MIPIIFEAPHQKAEVARLVKYCKELDGTEVRVFRWKEEPHNVRPPEICAMGFLWAGKQMAEPFFWLESDSIPLHPGWLEKCAAAYRAQDRPVMLTIDQQTPFDLIGGIGIYDPKFLREEMPEGIAGDGWDGWLIKYRNNRVYRSELIQHSYGRYTPDGAAHPWEFPRDQWIIRPSAQIFHKDKYQGLIDVNMKMRHTAETPHPQS